MTNATLPTHDAPHDAPLHATRDPRDDLPWWNIESPIRRRIKGTYLRRISFGLALVLLAMHAAPLLA